MRKLVVVLVIGAVVVSGSAFASAHWGGWWEEGEVTGKLDQLVGAGEITSSQARLAGSLYSAFVDLREEYRAERAAAKAQIESFLEDDVITAEELAELDEDHPFRDPDGRFADLLEDGQITAEELSDWKRGWRGYHPWGRWHGWHDHSRDGHHSKRSSFPGFRGNHRSDTENSPNTNSSLRIYPTRGYLT